MDKQKKDTSVAVKAAAAAHRAARLKREAMGIFKASYMRMTLTEDAYNATKGMNNLTFRHFVSKAIRDYSNGRMKETA